MDCEDNITFQGKRVKNEYQINTKKSGIISNSSFALAYNEFALE